MNEELDLSTMLDEFESEWTETEDAPSEESTEIEQEADPEVEEAEETPQTEEPQANPNDSDAEKRNRAFADLRRQADENKKYADFINRLAEDSGVKPEDILARYQERQLADRAEKQNVPVEILKRLDSLEQENKQSKEQLAAERLDSQIKTVEGKYGADENAVRSTFEYMFAAGVDPRTSEVDFEKFYRAANLDSIIQKEVANARQKDLEDKKKRQESASIANGTSATQTGGDLTDEDVDAMLEKMGIRI